MLRCGKTAQLAIAVMSVLAEGYGAGPPRWSSPDIAKLRKLPQPHVAKILTTLSTAGLLKGSRGPGGGYWLARHPGKITLADIVENFERDDIEMLCPFGTDWCGRGEPCPIHNDILSFQKVWDDYLHNTTLAVFLREENRRVGTGGGATRQGD